MPTLLNIKRIIQLYLHKQKKLAFLRKLNKCDFI